MNFSNNFMQYKLELRSSTNRINAKSIVKKNKKNHLLPILFKSLLTIIFLSYCVTNGMIAKCFNVKIFKIVKRHQLHTCMLNCIKYSKVPSYPATTTDKLLEPSQSVG